MSENKAIDKANLELALSENNKRLLEHTDTADTELRQDLNVMSQYQKYLNAELDSCYCGIKTPYTPVVGQYIPFIKVSGTFEVNNGRITIKPGQRVQINVTISYHNTANKTPANISYDIKDYTNNIVIGGIHPADVGDDSYEYPCAGFYQYTNETELNCEIGVYVNTIWSSDIIDINYTFLTVQEINRQIVIDPVEHVNTKHGLEDAPVGHIISHMGTKAPNHYLICDGSEYDILLYPELANHILDNFGSYNYFGGDGINTFAVPDLRGEFLRGTGTATRDTGSGAEVGEHQDPTKIPNLFAYDGTFQYTLSEDSGRGYNQPECADKGIYDRKSSKWTAIGTTDDTNYSDALKYTVRPTNTSVLYCIKYEPTYYTSVQNTNYLSASLYSLEERIVGSWIDGKPLYEKAFKFTSISSGRTDIKIDIDNPDTIFITHGYGINSDSNIMPITFPYHSTLNEVCSAFIKSTKDTICFRLGANVTWSTAIIITQYTKTIDAENSFTDDMIKDYITSSENHDSSYTDEEINSAIADSINLLNEV